MVVYLIILYVIVALVFYLVLYPVVVLGVVFVCTGGGILGTIHLAILSERGGVNGSFIQLMYGTYVANQSSMAVFVIRVFLYTLSFNTYSGGFILVASYRVKCSI